MKKGVLGFLGLLGAAGAAAVEHAGPALHGVGSLSHDMAPLSRSLAPLSHDFAPLTHDVGPLTHDAGPLGDGTAGGRSPIAGFTLHSPSLVDVDSPPTPDHPGVTAPAKAAAPLHDSLSTPVKCVSYGSAPLAGIALDRTSNDVYASVAAAAAAGCIAWNTLHYDPDVIHLGTPLR